MTASPIVRIANPVSGDNGMRAVQLVADFILAQLRTHRARSPAACPPLFVGVQGPQGCGKSHLTALLPAFLAAVPYSLRLASLSLDDLYSTHATLRDLAKSQPANKLVQGRGQPGTHDLALGEQCMAALKSINDRGSSDEKDKRRRVDLPVYDKSRFGGQGDRSDQVVAVEGPIDVVVFEGWMTGFGSLSDEDLARRYDEAKRDPAAYARRHLDYDRPTFIEHELEHLRFVNDELKQYERGIWSYLDCFVQLKPEEMSFVWDWRLQQEHNMMAQNGGVGMTDDQVRAFIARYMPGYELFLEGFRSDGTKWKGHGLTLVVGRSRAITGTQEF